MPSNYPVRYAPDQRLLPPNFLPLHPFDNGDMTLRDEMLLPHPRTPEAVEAMNADYYRYISYLDRQIGRILDNINPKLIGIALCHGSSMPDFPQNPYWVTGHTASATPTGASILLAGGFAPILLTVA